MATRARRLDGVEAVWTLRDLPELGATVPPLVPEPRARRHVHPALAGDRARHAGEAVVVVVADDPYRLADALDRVVVRYEPLPAAITPGAAVAPNGARVHEEWPDNLFAVSSAETGRGAAGFAEADVVVEGRFAYPRVAGMPIEPRGVLAFEDATTRRAHGLGLDPGAVRRTNRALRSRSVFPRSTCA